jgi:outer membrane lipoprotein-sorting protein
VIAGLAALAVSAGARAADPCDLIFNAMVAQVKVPFAVEAVQTPKNGPAQKMENRIVGGKSYFFVQGQWHSEPASPDQMIADLTEEKKSARQTCAAAGDEAVNGKPATVYTAHVDNQGEASDNKIWVAKDTGLPLKTEARMQEGTITQTFRYDGVEAPAGVR